MDDNNPKGNGIKKMNIDCDLINIGRWFLDLISDIMGCNCKK
jgi:hypothetical protein